jgi:NitT/TauT family transport system ATP-binding protein
MISCEQVDFAYSGQPVLRGISLTIRRAETVALLGRSGCGKTTLLKLLAGILRPSSGSILYESPPENSFAFVFQSPVFFPWLTVQQNVVKLCEFNGVRPEAARFLQPFGLAGAGSKYPWQLSGGMRRRLSIAMALSLQRPLLLLDEPGAGLDDWTKETLLDVLDVTLEERKTTCVFATHNLFEAAFLADRIILLGGSPAKVLLEHEVKLARPRLHGEDAFGQLVHEVERLRAALLPYREES